MGHEKLCRMLRLARLLAMRSMRVCGSDDFYGWG
jgi:hypothetical protein